MLWFKIDFHSGQPVYRQILNNFKSEIISGNLKAHEPIPSIRELARLLNVNPNTVARAFRELENEGLIYSRTGIGSFIAAPDQLTLEEKAVMTLYPELKRIIQLSRTFNMPQIKLVKLFTNTVDEIYGGDDL